MFIQIKDGQPVGYPVTNENMLKLIPSNVSIPEYPLTKDVIEFGFALYEYAQRPEYPVSDFKVVEEGSPVWTQDGTRGEYVTQVWNSRDMTPQEKNAAIEGQWYIVTVERNQKLYACDWTQLPDVPLTAEQKAEWVTYRQQLRDVTNQPDPFNITWPVAPQA